MDTITIDKLKLEYPLTWNQISKEGNKYINLNSFVKVRLFLENKGYSICSDPDHVAFPKSGKATSCPNFRNQMS